MFTCLSVSETCLHAPLSHRSRRLPLAPVVFAALLVTTGMTAFADSQRPLRSARSENGRFLLRIERGHGSTATSQPARDRAADDAQPAEDASAEVLPDADEPGAVEPGDAERDVAIAELSADSPEGRDGRSAEKASGAATRGRCRASLLDRRGERRGRVVWEAVLVNETAPVYGAVSDDGRFVVTMDEYRVGGAKHAVVIYDERGRRLREFRLRELLSRRDLREVKVRGQAVDWLSGARFRFEDDPATFIIELRSGREIYIDLERVELVDKSGAPLVSEPEEAGDDESLPAELEAMLLEADAEAMAGDDDQRGPELLAELARLLQEADPALDHGAQRELFDNLVAQIAELRTAGAAGPEIEAALRDSIDRALAESASQPTWPHEGPIDYIVDDLLSGENAPERAGALPDDAVPLAGNSGEFGIPVPQPALGSAEPVNYLDWMNAQRQTDPQAERLYQQAFAAYVPPPELPGESENLLDRALDDDPAALADPRLAEWLASNQAALDAYRSATQYEYRGGVLESEDGSMLGALLPQLAPMRQLAKANVATGRLAESQGRFDDAANAYLDTLDAGGQAGAGTTLIEGLVGQAVQGLATEAMLDLMAGDVDDTLDYTALRDDLAGVAAPRPIVETFQFERAMVMDVVQRTTELDPATGEPRFGVSGIAQMQAMLSMPGETTSNDARTLALSASKPGESLRQVNDAYDRMSSALGQPYPQGRDGLSQIEQELSTRTGVGADPLVGVLTPALSRASFLYTRGETNRRATTLVSELKAYKQQFGSYPDSLATLGTSSIVDPFTGQSFAYRREGDSFVLYSLGGNGVDDGGVHDRRGEQGDLVIWPRPPKE